MSDPPIAVPSYVRSPGATFLASLPVDRALARHDLAGSIAHVRMLERVGLVTGEESRALVGGLRTIAREIEAGTFPWREELEDVHTNLEVRLTQLVGPVGGKLHTARSRNDQIALDERLYLRSAIREVAGSLLALSEALLALAQREASTPMPGYTHLQRAQPVSVGHWLLAHFWRLDRDLDRLVATAERANVSPLGAGALATSTLPIDPKVVAEALQFDRPFENSIDAVSDRDYLAEFLFDLALLAVHLSSLSEEIVLWASTEFGFVAPTPALGAGSSLMPQKQNPDVPELVRGKTGRTVGDLVALLTTLKGLPLAYQRDLQEDKAPFLDAVATLTAELDALVPAFEAISFDAAHIHAAASDPRLRATDVAEQLVVRGVPFRQAHEAVGAYLAHHAGQLDAASLQVEFPDADTSWSTLLVGATPGHARNSPGGPGPEAVGHQLADAEQRLASRIVSLSSLARLVERVDELLKEDEP